MGSASAAREVTGWYGGIEQKVPFCWSQRRSPSAGNPLPSGSRAPDFPRAVRRSRRSETGQKHGAYRKMGRNPKGGGPFYRPHVFEQNVRFVTFPPGAAAADGKVLFYAMAAGPLRPGRSFPSSPPQRRQPPAPPPLPQRGEGGREGGEGRSQRTAAAGRGAAPPGGPRRPPGGRGPARPDPRRAGRARPARGEGRPRASEARAPRTGRGDPRRPPTSTRATATRAGGRRATRPKAGLQCAGLPLNSRPRQRVGMVGGGAGGKTARGVGGIRWAHPRSAQRWPPRQATPLPDLLRTRGTASAAAEVRRRSCPPVGKEVMLRVRCRSRSALRVVRCGLPVGAGPLVRLRV